MCTTTDDVSVLVQINTYKHLYYVRFQVFPGVEGVFEIELPPTYAGVIQILSMTYDVLIARQDIAMRSGVGASDVLLNSILNVLIFAYPVPNAEPSPVRASLESGAHSTLMDGPWLSNMSNETSSAAQIC